MISTSIGARSTASLLTRCSGAAWTSSLVCQPNTTLSLRSFASSSKLGLNASSASSLDQGGHPPPSPPPPPQQQQQDTRQRSSSVHASEIEHFSRLSSKWWDEHGEFGLLHAMNPVRIQFVREKLEEVWGYELAQQQVAARSSSSSSSSSVSPIYAANVAKQPYENLGRTQFLSGLDVADIGCGGGLFSESLARLGARTTGVDASSSNIGIATTHALRDAVLCRPHVLGGQSLTYLHTTAEELVAQGQTFDVVCAMEVVEHVNGPGEFLRSLDQLVKPGGHLFMSTIARTSLSWFLTIFMAENVLRLVTPGTHTHHQYINPKELVEFFQIDRNWYGKNHGNSTNLPQRMQFETRGTAYLPWKSSWTLAKTDTNLPATQECNYFFWARKPLTNPTQLNTKAGETSNIIR